MPEAEAATGVYVYGVLPADTEVGELPQGLDGAAVELLELEQVAAAVSEIAIDRPPGRRAEIMAHTAVLDALAGYAAVVPVQFGSIMADADSVFADLLAPHHDRFVAVLDRLRGTHQYDVRVRYHEQQGLVEVVSAHPEIADLRARTKDLEPGAVHPDLVRLGELVARAMEEQRDADAQDVWQAIAPHVLADVPRRVGGVEDVMDVAVLVADDAVEGLEESLEVLAEAVHERMRIRLMGPTAPYDFTEEQAWV